MNKSDRIQIVIDLIRSQIKVEEALIEYYSSALFLNRSSFQEAKNMQEVCNVKIVELVKQIQELEKFTLSGRVKEKLWGKD